MRVILLGMEILRHVDATSPPPSKSTSNATPMALLSHRAMTLIFQSCEIEVWMEIDHLGTAREMWDHLRHMFEHFSSTHKYVVVQDISYLHQCDRFVREYVTKMWSL